MGKSFGGLKVVSIFSCILFLSACSLNSNKAVNGDGIMLAAPIEPPPPGYPWTPNSSITFSPVQAPADGVTSATITFTIRDYYMNPVPGMPISFSATGTGNTLVEPVGVTNSAGVIYGSIKSSTIQTSMISVDAPSLVAGLSAPLEFVDWAPSATTSTITGTSGVAADGTSSSTITIRIRNAGGVGLAGFTPTFSATDSGGTNVYGVCSLTNVSGITNCQLSSTYAEVKTLTITSPVVKTGGAVTFVAGPPSAANSLFSAAPNNLTANGSATSTISIQLRDANNNPVQGVSPIITSTGLGNSIAQPGATNTLGQTTATITSTVAQSKTLGFSVPGGLGGLTTTVLFVAGPPSASTSTITASPNTGTTADGSAASTVTITLKDANNNVVSGVNTTFASTGTGNTLTQSGSTTDSGGQATGTIKSTKAETKTLSIASPAGLSGVTATDVFVAGAFSAGNSTITGTSSIVANGVATSAVTITLKDANNNAISGVVPTFTATDTGSTNTYGGCSSSNASGVSVCTLKSTKAETKTLSISSPGISAGGSVTFIAGAPAAGNSTITLSPNTGVTADGSAASTVTITLKDAFNNPVSGSSAAFSSTGTGNTLTQPAASTDSNGQTTGIIKSTKAETKTVAIATPAGFSAVNAPITFVAGPPSAAHSTLSASASSGIPADGSATSTITITLKDANNNPVSGATATIASSGSGNTLTQPGSVTDASGQTTATIASTVVQTKTISIASPAGLGGVTTPVGFVPGAASAATSTISTSPASGITADGVTTSTVTITLKDAMNNPIPGAIVAFAATGTGNTLVQPGLTDLNGQATGTIKSTNAGSKTVNISTPAGLTADTASVGFIAGAPVAANSTITGSGPVAADSVATSTVTITLLDANSNPVSGVVPTFSATDTGSTNGYGVCSSTNGSGVSTCTLSSTHAETKTLQIASPVVKSGGTVSFTAGSASAANSTISASPNSGIAADGTASSTLTLTLKDAFNNPVSGVTPNIGSTGTGNTITQPASATNASGQTTATLKSTVAESKTVSISSPAGFGAVSTSVGFVAGAPNAAHSSISATTNITADGSSTSTVTLTIRDVNNNPVSGVSTSFASTGTGNTLGQPGSSTNASGQATATIASTKAEVKTLNIATPAGFSGVTTTTTFVAGAPVAANSTIAGGTTPVADGSATANVTITLKDAFNNPVSGITPAFSASGSGNTVAQPGSATNASGQAVGTVASTVSGTKTLSITSPAGFGGVTGLLTFTAGAPSAANSTISASPGTGVTADGSTTSTVTITIRDANNNPCSGITTALASTGTGNTITQPGGTTNGFGITTASIVSTMAESKTLSLSSPAGFSGVTTTVGFISGGVSIANSTITGSGPVVANGVATSTVTITLKDGSNNPVSGITPTFTATDSGSQNAYSACSSTNASGVSTCTFTSTYAESKTLSIATPVTKAGGTVSFTAGAAVAANSSISASPTSLTADGTTTSTVTLTLRDAFNNPVSGVTTAFAATGTGNTLVQPGSVTDSQGHSSGTIKSTKAEGKTISISTPAGFSGVTNTLTFVAGSAVAANSTIAVSPSSLTADGSTTSTVTITLKDANNNPVSGVSTSFASTGTGNTLTQPAVATDSSGQATGTIKSTVAQGKTLSIATPAGFTGVTTGITFVAGSPVAANSTISASPGSLTADGTTTSTVTITLRDVNNNPVSGITPVFASTGTGNTLVQAASATNASGQASGTIKSTVAEAKTVSITSPAGLTSVTGALTFVAGAPSASTSTISASPGSGITADGTSTSAITITIRDAQGNPVSGVSTTFASTGTGNTLTQPGSVTDASGQATATIKSTVAQTKTLNIATPVALTSVTNTVGFAAGGASAAQSTITISPTSITADGATTSTVTVTLKDTNGNPITGSTVAFAMSGSGNTIVQPVSTTDASGQATGTVKSTVAEGKTLNISTPGGLTAVQATATFVAGAPVAANSTISSSPASVTADGSTTSNITITLRDANNNPVSGQTVAFASTGTSNTLVQPISVTNASGQASGTIKSTKAEVKTVSISTPAGFTSVTGTVTFTAGAGSVANSGISASPASVTADGTTTSTVTITLRDANNNPISGVTPAFASTGTGNTLVQPVSATNASGQTTATIKSTVAESKTLSITSPAGLSGVTGTLTFVAGSASTANSTIAVSTGTLTADGSTTSTVAITLKDANNNPISGATAAFASTGTGNTLVQPASVTNASGQTTGTIKSTVAESKTLSLSTPAFGTVTTSINFVAGPVNAANCSISASPSSGLAADGTAISTVTVTLRDANNNPVSGQTVTIASTGTGNTITQPGSTTSAAGQTTATLKSTKAETKTLSISAPAGLTGVTTSATFVPGAASATNSTISTSPTSITADGTTTSTVTITLKDANNNPISGSTVTFSATGSSETLVQPASATNASGQATGTIKSTLAQSSTLSIASPAGLSGVTTGLTFVAGPAVAATSTIAASPASVTADGTTTTTVTITLKDAQGNPVSGITPTFASTGTGNTLVQPASATNASGQSTGTIKSTVAEAKTLSISSPAGFSGVTNTVTFVPGAASAATSTITASPNTNVTADGSSASTITVTLKDAQGNLISGQSVVLTATGTGNTLTQPGSTTNGSGQTTGTLKSTVAATKTVSISTPSGLTGLTATVAFVAGAPSSTTSTLSATPTSLTANGTSSTAVTMTLKDAQGNVVSGVSALFASTGTGNTLTQPVAVTNGSGVASGSMVSTVAEAKTLSISTPVGLSSVTTPITFVAGPAVSATSTIVASPTSVTADGTTTTTVTVTIKDANGNPVSGTTVAFASTGTGNTLVQPASVTNASGQASGTLKSTKAETKTLSIATPASFSGTSTVTFVAGTPVTANSTITATPTSGITANGTASSTVTITLKDANNNLCTGVSTTIASTGTGNTITQPASVTNASGQATATIVSTKAESKTVSIATPAGLSGNTVGLTFVAGPASATTSTIVASPASLRATGSTSTTVTITLLDANNNPVSGSSAAFTATGTGNTLTQPVGTTNASGVITGSMVSTGVGAKTLAISSPAGLTGVTSTVTFVGLNLQVPIELWDIPIQATTTALIHNRTSTTFNPSDYDGTVTYEFEIVCTNTETSAAVVTLYNATTSAAITTITVPTATTNPTRFITSFTPTAGANTYKVQTPATTSSLLTCYTGRFIVTQSNASKTKIYIPLTAGIYNSADSVNTSSSLLIDSNATSTFGQGDATKYVLWKKDSTKYVTLDTTTPYQLEAVTSGGAQVALYNKTTGLAVTGGSLVAFNGGTIAVNTSSAIADNAANFTNGNDFEVRFADFFSTGYLYKAGIWVKLMGPLNQADVYYRVEKDMKAVAATTNSTNSRVKLDTSKFLVPTVYFESTGYQPSAGTSSVSLLDVGVNDFGTSGSFSVGSSSNSLSGAKTRTRSAAITPVSADRFIPSVNITSGTATVNSCFLIVNAQ